LSKHTMPMRINIQTKNIDLTDAIRAYVDEKIASFGKLLPEAEDPVVAIELSKERNDQNHGDQLFKAEINLSGPHRNIFAEAKTADLYASIDQVKDVAIRELREQKERSVEEYRAGAREAKAALREE